MFSRVANQTLTKTIASNEDLLNGARVGSFQVDFSLCEADYIRLKQGDTWLSRVSASVFFGAVGFGIDILPKFISQNTGGRESISTFEWQTFAWVASIGGLLFIGSFLLPSEKKRVLSKIARHFKSEPRTRHLIRRK
jgi:hypothetical protein